MTPVLGNILQPLIDFFHWFLEFFHDSLGLGWGTAIVALTVMVRAVLLPVTYKSSKSMIRLQQLAPEMKSLQTKYKQDPQRLQQETMKFYRENQVNPFASCLPMIAQLPVFLALFYMLQDDLRYDICPEINPPGSPNPQPCGETHASSFLFIPDLTDKATGAVLVALIVLYVGSQLVSTLLMSATADKNQRRIFLALPFLFVAFIWNFPAGLLVYWITTNLWTILQQSIIKKRLGPAARAGDGRREGGEGGAGGREGQGRQGQGQGRRRPRAREALAGHRGRRRLRRVEAAQRPAPGAAAQEEEALGAPAVTDDSASDRVRELLERVNEALDLDARVEVEQDDEGIIRATLHAEDLGLFIGRHGTTIDAVQHLAYRIAAAAEDRPQRVIVDAAGYRERREQALHRQADEAAEDAVRSRRPVALDAMSATERKVVHEHLKDREDVETYSEGNEPDRHLVVAPLD